MTWLCRSGLKIVLYPLGLCDANAIERQFCHIWHICLAGRRQALENIIVFDMMASAPAHEDALGTYPGSMKEHIMELKTVRLTIPEEANIIVGQSHFIKTVEDLYEIMVTTVPGVKFGLAFNEASGPCLIRSDGNDESLISAAIENCRAMQAGHVFNLLMLGAYPINVLDRIKQCQEVCRIFCATANPLEVVVAATEQGTGVLGVIDGNSPVGVESAQDKEDRARLLTDIIGYKR
jgi:adenosine/AMP kinase